MNRVEFTKQISQLINRMNSEGELPILDWVKRSTEEQSRMFRDKLSKCDGKTIVSQHQRGLAADIYFRDQTEPDRLVDPIHSRIYWHEIWETMGGKPMITWDQGHFEG